MEFGFLKYPRTLSIMPTFGCSAACEDCGTLSSPKDKTNLELSKILSAITQAKDLNFSNVVFTGGEATLRWKDLIVAIRHATHLGFPTRLVTNGHWARSLVKTNAMLDELVESGLKEINFSTGDEHIRFVSLDNVIRGTLSAIEKKLSVAIMVEYKKDRSITKRTLLNHHLIRNLSDDVINLININESPWMPLNPMQVEKYPQGVAVNIKNISASLGCSSVLQTYVIQPNGNIGSCCGLGMRIVRELNTGSSDEGDFFLRDAIENAEKDFLKMWIHYMGPEKILAWAATKNSSIKWEDMYGHRCQACLRLYKDPIIREVIREHYHEMINDIISVAFMDDVFIPTQFKKYVQV
jgi:organic radical activating enzyme